MSSTHQDIKAALLPTIPKKKAGNTNTLFSQQDCYPRLKQTHHAWSEKSTSEHSIIFIISEYH